MTGVGRPSEIDGSGEIVEKKVVNVNIPVKLIEFLKKKGINRSELFSKSIRKLYEKELCPKCYGGEGVINTHVGIKCLPCSYWIALNPCPNCEAQYQPHYNMLKQFPDGKVGCEQCVESDSALEKSG